MGDTTTLMVTSTAVPPSGLAACPSGYNTTEGQSCLYNVASTAVIYEETISITRIAPSGEETQPVTIAWITFVSASLSSAGTTSTSGTSDSSPAPSTASSPSVSQDGDTSNAAASPTTTSSSDSLPPGAVAGAAIGCFIAGALIATLAAFFFFKKRSQRNRHAARSTYVPASEPRFGGEKGTPLVAVAAVGGLDFLPEQADDAEIQRKVSTVVDQIDQHVENFYSNSSIPLNANVEAELSRFETSQLPRPLAACFEHAANPTTLIKHCLAFHIFNLTLAPGEGTEPLLPPDLAGTISAVYTKSLLPSTSKDTLAAFSSWKALTSYLRPGLTRDPKVSRSTSESASRVASHFTNVFSPWAKTQYSKEDRSRHLTEVITHSIQTAIWLFGQPDTFKFDWSMPAQDARQSTAGRTASNVVLVPAVFKVTHNGARLGGTGQNVLKPVVKRF